MRSFSQFVDDAGHTRDYLFYFLVDMMLKFKDKLTQKQLVLFLISKGNVDSVSYYLTKRTRIKCDLNKNASLARAHINVLHEIVSHLGLNLIYSDLARKRNILAILSLNEEITFSFERHLIAKSKRYRTYLALTKYVQLYPAANKRKILSEVFKERNHFKAKIALHRLRGVPEFEKFFTMY